jgi:predicted RecB family nuclease
VTDDIFAAFLNCRYMAYLKLRGESGDKSDYERLQARLSTEYRATAREDLLRKHAGATVVQSPPSLQEAIQTGAALITDPVVSDAGESCRLDALERVVDKEHGIRGVFRPVHFLHTAKVSTNDRLLLGFGATILARVQGVQPGVGRIVHGPQFKSSRVELASVSAAVADATGQIGELAAAVKPPPLVLNKHCPECEFRKQCRAAAADKDDLSLLRGLSAKEVSALHERGIFTITQYSYTFRPGGMKRAAASRGRRHDYSLQALAIREKTVYVAERPQIPDAKARLYLDVEGLPEEDFYYLIGLTIDEGGQQRRLSFWADSQAEEATIWAAFLEAIRPTEEYALFHYGSYESHFLDRMAARHGGDPALIARVRSRAVNLLSLLHARVYFPAYGNDLKSVAYYLGFRWSDPDASGLQSVVWRYDWQATRDESLKQRLLTYNREDCAALERLVEVVEPLGDEHRQPAVGSGTPVASVANVAGPYRHKFGATPFTLPEFARITKCAYFDYQRSRVLCRTSPRVKQAVRRKRRPVKQVWKVNREVEWGRPPACTVARPASTRSSDSGSWSST